MESAAIYEKVIREVILMTSSRGELLQAVQHHPDSPYKNMHQHPVTDHIEAVRNNIRQVTAIIDDIVSLKLTEQQRRQMDHYIEERNRYVNEGLNPACSAILDGEYDKANEVLLSKALPLCNLAVHEAESFGNVGMVEQTVCTLSLIFGGAMTGLALLMALS